MATSQESRLLSESRRSEHLRLLEDLENLQLNESCCDICHCDCLSSHRSYTEELLPDGKWNLRLYDSNNNNSNNKKQKNPKSIPGTKTKVKSKNLKKETQAKTTGSTTSLNEKGSKISNISTTIAKRKRSKSASSLRGSSPQSQLNAGSQTTRAPPPSRNKTKYSTRDCKILQELLSSLDPTPRLEITAAKPTANDSESMPASSKTLPRCTQPNSNLSSLKLCDSMANLCLAPSIRNAFQQVPIHDKKILNRMASKRSERAAAKENAWLARKYWENERYERELLKCEQMEEYKRAIRDKQFQDYLLTKQRLNAIAKRDLAELQRLKESLHAKELRTKKRLDALRIERDMQLCQRRCDELRKSEAVNIQQEEQQLEDVLRKHDICQRLTERLQRADAIRTQMLDGYLKRLRYDNYLEQLVHEEHWREAQQYEQTRRAQLKEHISRKRSKSQRFVDERQRQNAALSNMAKISASLRELVRNSVTPEGGTQQLGAGVSTSNLTLPAGLGHIVIDRPLSKLSLE